METTGTIRFETRKDKADETGLMPVRLIYSISNQRKTVSTGKHIRGANWNSETQTAVYVALSKAKKEYSGIRSEWLLSEYDVTQFNKALDKSRELIRNIERDYRRDEIQYTSEMVVKKVIEKLQPETKKADPLSKIYDWIVWYCENYKDVHKPKTIAEYMGVANHIKSFDKKQGANITFSSIDMFWMNAFKIFLTKTLVNTTVAKKIGGLKTLLRRAEDKFGIKVNPAYSKFKEYGREDSRAEVIALNEDELQAIIDLDLSDSAADARQRDVFVFACHTGLRYSDLADLKREHIKDGVIIKNCVKTNIPVEVPLTTTCKNILKKYGTYFRPLPIISNDKCRKHIKKIARLAGLDTPIERVRYMGVKRVAVTKPKHELIGVHTARKTFVTLVLRNNIPQQVIMSMTGHTDQRSFKRYVDVNKAQRENAVKSTFDSGNKYNTA